jgi:hypothetical protein
MPKTDEQRLKEIQARMDKRKKAEEYKKTISSARDALKKLRSKKS